MAFVFTNIPYLLLFSIEPVAPYFQHIVLDVCFYNLNQHLYYQNIANASTLFGYFEKICF